MDRRDAEAHQEVEMSKARQDARTKLRRRKRQERWEARTWLAREYVRGLVRWTPALERRLRRRLGIPLTPGPSPESYIAQQDAAIRETLARMEADIAGTGPRFHLTMPGDSLEPEGATYRAAGENRPPR
jgi:hypothetical protein